MREIKFRAWDNENKKMRYIDISWFSEDDLPYFNHGLMQFTGLHDKNGKEIYEGDIVATEGQIAVVEFSFSKGMFCVAGDTSLYHVVSNYKVEVIGNIYDNPELLKEAGHARKLG